MTIAADTRFGFYEVLAQIRAGGMGEVYQAYDTKLGRDVAIEVLPRQLFPAMKPSEQARAALTQINVVLNWFEELKQKVPPGKK